MEKSLHIIQDILLAYSNNEHTTKQKEVVRNLREFYHEYVWRWPALIISGSEAEGAEVEKFRRGYNDELREIQTKYPKETDELSEDARRVGLLPGSSDYQALVQGTPEPLQELEKASVDIY